MGDRVLGVWLLDLMVVKRVFTFDYMPCICSVCFSVFLLYCTTKKVVLKNHLQKGEEAEAMGSGAPKEKRWNINDDDINDFDIYVSLYIFNFLSSKIQQRKPAGFPLPTEESQTP